MNLACKFVLMAGLGGLLTGCTNEQQLENANEDLQEERMETQEELNEAEADGVVTGEEQEDLREQAGDQIEAQGEVREQQGELIESEVD